MKKAMLFILLILVITNVYSQRISEITFSNKPVTSILLTLGKLADVQIIPDETVTGNASIFFQPMSLESALALLLDTYNFYYWKENGIYKVSKIRFTYNEKTKSCSLDTRDVDIMQVLNKISSNAKVTILKDPLPRDTSSYHIQDQPLDEVLKIISHKFADYKLEISDNFYYFKKIKKASTSSQKGKETQHFFITDDYGNLSVNADNKRFKELLDSLFIEADFEYSILGRNDSIIPKFSFEEKPVPEMLNLLMEQGDSDYMVSNNIYYIFDIDHRDVLKKYNTSVPIQLKWLQVNDLPNLFPAGLASANNYRLDRNTNTIILYGTLAQITPIEKFINLVDTEGREKNYVRIELNSLKVSELKNLLPPELKNLPMINLPDSNTVIFDIPSQKEKILHNFLNAADKSEVNEPIALKYIRSEDLLNHLPPSVTTDNIVTTEDPAVIFFKGSEVKKETFLKELNFIDKPVPQIRYDILVIQYLISDGSAVTPNMSASYPNDGTDPQTNKEFSDSATGILKSLNGSLGGLLGINFDILTNFGLHFGMDLQMSLNESKAKILTDTRLVGISGVPLKFENTQTSRFRIPETDNDTGETKPGSSQKITSGLIIEIESWISGNGLISMKVSASFSKQHDVSDPEVNLPPTSDKVITTNVWTQSGEPIIIGGLFEKDLIETVTKTPFFGDIPLIGILFKQTTKAETNTEMVIYILPQIENLEEESTEQMYEEYYQHYFSHEEAFSE